MNRHDFLANTVGTTLGLGLVSFIVWILYMVDYTEHNHARAKTSDTHVIVNFVGEEKARPVYVNDHGNIVKVWEPSE